MPHANSLRSNWLKICLALAAVIAFGVPSFARTMPKVNAGNTPVKGVADDWTHHHVVFSNPGTEEQAIKGGHYGKWNKIVNDPRYVMQQMRRGLPGQGPAATDASAFQAARMTNHGIQPLGPGRMLPKLPHPVSTLRFPGSSTIKQDWNESIGTTTAPTPLAFPAKWSSFNTSTASCTSDFVVYPTGQAGSSSQASIIAYYNLYAGGCSGTVPNVDWAYDTGGTVSLSPVFSENGNQIAFIQSSDSTASLVLLTVPLTPPGSGTIASPTAPLAQTASSYYNGGSGCTAPCSYTVALSGNPDDTWSSPYYDYSTDTLFVGDSNGRLHKFNPVFNGVPTEVVTSLWPVQMAYGSTPTPDTNQLNSPVYDPASGYVLVGSTTSGVGSTSGGRLYSVVASTGVINGYSSQLDNTYGIRDAVLMDPIASTAYVFVGNDPSGNNLVYQFPLNFTSSTTPAVSTIATGSHAAGSTAYQLSGTFDNTYYTSSSGTNPTGNIYMCSTASPARLFQIPIINGTMSTTATVGPTLGNSANDIYQQNDTYDGRCSPITEFYNNSSSTDYLFLSVFVGYPAGCTDDSGDGCVLSYNVTTPSSFGTGLTPGGELNVSSPFLGAPTGGIIIDNAATNLSGGASQIYFLTQSPSGTLPCTGVCAVQASQAALQ